MVTCKKCGAEFDTQLKACPQCGAKKKKSKAPVIIILVLVVLLAAGGGYAYWWYLQNHTPYKTFDVNCAQFTEAINRKIDEEDRKDLHMASAYWTRKGNPAVPVYEGAGFTMTAKTGSGNTVEENIRELRVGTLDTEDNRLLAALSVLALEEYQTKDVILTDIENVMLQRKDTVSYNVVAFSYDRSADELVLIPSDGAETPTGNTATADEPRFTANRFVGGSGFIKAGGKYIFSDGEAIRYRDAITDNNTKIIEDKNDGQLLSDGETLFYVNDDGNSRRVCMVGVDGRHPLTLMNLAEQVTLLTAHNNCLYYVTESPALSGNYAFCRYRFDLKEAEKFNDIRFAPNRAVISGNLLYCTALPATGATPDSAASDPQGDVYTFNFDTEKFDKVLSDCRVSAHGFFNGAGNPCFDSYQTDAASGKLLQHYLYTSQDGVLKRSPAVTVDAVLWMASPANSDTVLCDNPNRRYYWFNRTTGAVQEMELPAQGVFAFDVEHPENLYLCVSDDGKLTHLYQITDGVVTERGFNASGISVAANPVIVNGYVLDVHHDAYVITDEPLPQPTETTTEPVTEAEATTGAVQ